MLTQLNFFDMIKAEMEKAGTAVKNEVHHLEPIAKKDWRAVSTDLMLAGQKCGTNQICQELASYGINESQKIDAEMVNQWMTTGKHGQWCASNKICTEAVQKALTTANTKEAAAMQHWLHPSALMNLNWMDDFRKEAAKVKAAAEAEAAKVKAAAAADWTKVSTDLSVAGQKCGTNPICQELASYGVNVNHHIDVIVVRQWLKEGKWGQWCASNKTCMDAVHEAIHDSTKAERNAVNHWLHPKHTATSLLQNLALWDTIKNDVKEVGHDFIVAGQMCGSNSICVEIAQKGTSLLENGETTLVMGWIGNNKDAAWCKNNSLCMDIVNHGIADATAEETHLINEWLHVSSLMNLNIWDNMKKDATKAWDWTKGAAHTVGHDLSVAGQKCGSNSICTEIAQKGTAALEKGETTMVMNWINTNKNASWCKGNKICMEIVTKAISAADTEETKLINEWLHQPTIILMII
jgi:hypothetical protein